MMQTSCEKNRIKCYFLCKTIQLNGNSIFLSIITIQSKKDELLYVTIYLVVLDIQLCNKMAKVNLDGSSDLYFRYKMPKLEINVCGASKMIRTYLTNIEAVAKAINRPSIYLIKFFGQQLNKNTTVCKEKTNEKSFISGKVEEKVLQQLCMEFIEKYVLCKLCKNPETEMFSDGKKKKKKLYMKCISCGETKEIKQLGSDKIVKYMILRL